jgi:hypothetical protein
MEKITVHIGTIQSSSGNVTQDTRRPVEFVGEELASYTEYGYGRDGAPTDTRGITETLYRTEDDRLVVHTEDWSRWQGEPSTEVLQGVEESDLRAGGRYEQLGFEAGFQDALTLDQALSRNEPVEPDLYA